MNKEDIVKEMLTVTDNRKLEPYNKMENTLSLPDILFLSRDRVVDNRKFIAYRNDRSDWVFYDMADLSYCFMMTDNEIRNEINHCGMKLLKVNIDIEGEF